MQPIAPVTVAELLGPVQRMRYKVEVYDGASWYDLSALGGKDYLKSVSVSLGGARMSTEPIAGSWSATLDNENSIFHPLHPTSAYASLLRIGREVRISVGGNYGAGAGVDYLWQRVIGFMDAPRFDHGSKTVEISGLDYTKLLTDTVLRDQNPVSASGSPWASGSLSGALDDIIDGPLHWGRVAVFDSVATGGIGAELYAEGDACEIGAGEADSVGTWVNGGSGLLTSEGPAQQSAYMLRLERETPWPSDEYCEDTAVCAVVAGQRYIVDFWARILYAGPSSGGYARLAARQSVGQLGTTIVSEDGGAWGRHQMILTAAETGNLCLRYISTGKFSQIGDRIELDEVSVRTYNPDSWNRYVLPPAANGPYFVTLDGNPVGQGEQDSEIGWHYDPATRSLYFPEGMTIPNGTANLRIYYYTDRLLEDVLADILKWCGLYATRAAALADMDYVPTGVTLGRVWFEPNTTALTAVRMICERVDYRFWFAFDGRPCFKPAPVATAIDFLFTEPGHLQALSDYHDDQMVRNRITIEGAQRAMYQASRDDKANDKYKGEAVDPAVVAGTRLERTYPITNHLFQGQAPIYWMCALLLSEFKDEKLYSDVGLFALPVPLELGDVIEWPLELEPSSDVESASGSLVVPVMGIIRDIKISNAQATYRVEIANEFWSTGMLPSGCVMPSGSPSASTPSGLPSGSPSGILITETFDFGTEGDEDEAWVVPTGVSHVEAEAWGPGGIGGPTLGGASDLAGGGGGGGGRSVALLAVTPGETLDLHFPDAAPDDAEIYRGANCLLRAKAGLDASDQFGAPGGSAAVGIGDVKHDGGRGADTSTVDGGGGGSSAGTAADGNDAHDINGASAPTGGGAGGDGGVEAGNGADGTTPGGGGGGAGYDFAISTIPGVGGYGRIRISYWS